MILPGWSESVLGGDQQTPPNTFKRVKPKQEESSPEEKSEENLAAVDEAKPYLNFINARIPSNAQDRSIFAC